MFIAGSLSSRSEGFAIADTPQGAVIVFPKTIDEAKLPFQLVSPANFMSDLAKTLGMSDTEYTTMTDSFVASTRNLSAPGSPT